MKFTVKKEEYKKITVEVNDINIAEETLYFWHNGIRRAYSVKPVWTTWNVEHYDKEEEIWKLDIIEVDPAEKVHSYSVQLTEIESILRNTTHPLWRLIDNYCFSQDNERRTKEQFMGDYESTLSEIHKQL